MSGKFQVGDVCEIVRNFNIGTHYCNGRECTIVSIGAHVGCHSKGPMGHCHFDCHVTVAGCGPQVFCCEFACLRKKPPPADRQQLGRWDLCPWQPKKVREPVEVKT